MAMILLATSVQIPDVNSLLQYGVLGMVFLAMVLGKIVPGYILDRKDAEMNALKAENAAMRLTLEEKVIPALTRSTDVLAQYVNSQVGGPYPRGNS